MLLTHDCHACDLASRFPVPPPSMPFQRSRQRGQRLPLAAMLLCCAMLAAACSEEPAGASVPIARYGLATVPGSVLAGTPARQPLERLTREPCDIEAASALSRALAEAGYRREAAGLRLAFAGNCPRGRDLLPGRSRCCRRSAITPARCRWPSARWRPTRTIRSGASCAPRPCAKAASRPRRWTTTGGPVPGA